MFIPRNYTLPAIRFHAVIQSPNPEPMDTDEPIAYIKRPVAVRAVQVMKTQQVQTREGVETASAGDWIVTGAGSESWRSRKRHS